MTVAARLWFGLALIVIAVGFLLGVQSYLHAHINREMGSLNNETFAVLEHLRMLESDGMAVVATSHELLHLKTLNGSGDLTPAALDAVRAAIDVEVVQRREALAGLREHSSAYSALVVEFFPAELELERAVTGSVQELVSISEWAFARPHATGDGIQSFAQRAAIDAVEVRFRRVLDDASRQEKAEVGERTAALHGTLATTEKAIWLGAALLVAVVLLVLRSIERSTLPQLHELITVLRQVGEGDLSRRATLHARNELGDLAVALNASLERLAESERRRVEAASELRALNEQLNQLVEARTHELWVAKEQVEIGSRAKSRFLDSISHEFRTPLTSVLGYADLLALTDGPNEFASAIAESGLELLALVDSALALSEIDHEAIHIDLRVVRLDKVLKEALAEVAQLAHREQVRIDRGAVSQVQVLANDKHLKTVLVHLLTNAVIYNRPDGSVKVSWNRNDGGLIELSVVDTGSGFTEEHPGQALEPFERLGRFASTVRGAGVGLTIVESFTRAMGGKLEYASTPGVGSTFRLTLIEAQAQ